MALKTIDENPTTADIVYIELDTPDASGCFAADPYQVDSVKIYFVERTFAGNDSTYNKQIYDTSVKTALDAAIATACTTPSAANLATVQTLTDQLNASVKIYTFHYSDAVPVLIVGSPANPAWITSDQANAQIIHVVSDANGNVQYGKFAYEWNPVGMREGDYFICLTWSPNPSGDKLTSQIQFSLGGATELTTSIPTHFTDPLKYSTLLERYLPEIYKQPISSSDLTPQVFQEFDNSIAQSFTDLENQANQILDLIDANATREYLLTYLARLFNLNLYSNDPTLWRRQIKNAVPLFKQKGTLSGLKTALAQAGITLTRYAQIWQVKSQYTWQDYFLASDSLSFALSKLMILPVDTANFELHYRSQEGDWQLLSSDYVTFSNTSGVTTMTWVGANLSVNPVQLFSGDGIRVIYEVTNVPFSGQTVENYIRSLPLLDDRDETLQTYPPKNWNIRIIEEDDAMFNSVVPDRNPFIDLLNYGWVRTEFPYSENIYNMEEYNGSRRESTNPCDIDRDFIDSCGACVSTKYVVDLQIDKLSNDRILEATKILSEYTPFHAILHSVNLTGSVDEFIEPPAEDLKSYISYQQQDFTVSGNAEQVFNRLMLPTDQIKRNELANVNTVVTNGTGTGANQYIMLYCPEISIEELPVDPANNYLEVLSPSINAGAYQITSPSGNYAQLTGTMPAEPLNQSSFTFRLSNNRAHKNSGTIHQDDLFQFYDATTNWELFQISTTEDGATPWNVYISGHSYTIVNVLPDGGLVLADPSRTLPVINTSGMTYSLRDNVNNIHLTSNSGHLIVTRRGRVDVGELTINGNNVYITDIRNFLDKYYEYGRNHYIYYNGTQYPLIGFVETSSGEIYIGNYTSGDVTGASYILYHRLINGKTGQFGYQGLTLTTTTNYEVSLHIQNGANAASLYPATDAQGHSYTQQLENNSFKENFLILIGTEYFAIKDISGTTIYLCGPTETWKKSGTAKTFDILQYIKIPAHIPASDRTPEHDAHTFNYLDRRGNEVIEIDINDNGNYSIVTAQAFNQEDGNLDLIGQEESVTFSIKMLDEE